MEKLIINKRHEMPFWKRMLWDIVTILLWVGWIYLWKPLLIVFYQIITLKVPPEMISDTIWDEIKSVQFEHAVFMLIATPVVLFALSRIHRHKNASTHLIYDAKDYATYFHLNEVQLHNCVDSQLITVYHDEHGRISSLEDQIYPNTLKK